jgi:hypothetical protein
MVHWVISGVGQDWSAREMSVHPRIGEVLHVIHSGLHQVRENQTFSCRVDARRDSRCVG